MQASREAAGSAEPRDAALLDRLRQGEAEAFDELVRAHIGRMRVVAARILRDRGEADDAVQDAFLSAFAALPRFDGQAQLGTWLHRITVNAALQKLRKRGRLDVTDQEVDALLPVFGGRGPFAAPQVRFVDAPEQAAMHGELRAAVVAGIAKLPEAHRAALVLRDLEQLSYPELAERMGLTVNAVKIRVHRARQALRELLQPTFGVAV